MALPKYLAILTGILLIFGKIDYSSGDKILFLLPLASRSHVHVFEPLMKALAERNHQITTLSPVVSPEILEFPNVRHIQIITLEDLLGDLANPFDQRKTGLLSQLFNSSGADHIDAACAKAVRHPKLHDLVTDDNFDLVIVDIFLNYCVLGVIPALKAPSILVSTLSPPPSIANVVGNRLPASFVPSVFLGYSDKMTFAQRLANVLMENLIGFVWDKMLISKSTSHYRKHLPGGENLPDVYEIQGNTSMIFANSHFSLNYPRPLLPDVVEVGGMHTRPAKKLPKDLDKFLEGSGKEGFIFFSLGSIVKPQDMPEETRKVFVNVFGRLKQRVLWKWNGEEMSDLPNNVMISKWLPQQDILGHPKIKLFMTHGGLLSTQESVYHGVPVLGLPVFGDQDLNIHQAEKGGYAKFVEIVDLSENELEAALNELISNPSYSRKVKELAKLSQDLPRSPLDTAVYWTEYVLRHKGAVHLRSAARELNFFQYYVLDVIAVILMGLSVLIFMVIKCCKCCCKKVFCRDKKNLKRKAKRE